MYIYVYIYINISISCKEDFHIINEKKTPGIQVYLQ